MEKRYDEGWNKILFSIKKQESRFSAEHPQSFFPSSYRPPTNSRAVVQTRRFGQIITYHKNENQIEKSPNPYRNSKQIDNLVRFREWSFEKISSLWFGCWLFLLGFTPFLWWRNEMEWRRKLFINLWDFLFSFRIFYWFFFPPHRCIFFLQYNNYRLMFLVWLKG